MRFPSLFRLPKYQRFEIKPRYYDPIKEEIEERRKQIEQSQLSHTDTIPEAVSTRFKFKRSAKKTPITSMIQLGMAGFLGALFFGWLEFGNQIFYYLLWASIPFYLIYRIAKFRKNR